MTIQSNGATRTLSHKGMTAHVRKRIKLEGIPARVSLYKSCGFDWIRVIGAKHDQAFSGEQARKIAIIAKVNGLTGSMGLEIDDSVARWADSGATNFHFVYPGNDARAEAA